MSTKKQLDQLKQLAVAAAREHGTIAVLAISADDVRVMSLDERMTSPHDKAGKPRKTRRFFYYADSGAGGERTQLAYYPPLTEADAAAGVESKPRGTRLV